MPVAPRRRVLARALHLPCSMNGAASGGREAGRLFLARHGATAANVRRIRAPVGAVLIPQGREQARRLGAAAARLGVDVVWASPLPRARETAEIVAGACGVPLHLDADLRDLEEGPWAGLAEEEIERRYPVEYALWQRQPQRVRLPGRESLHLLRRRVLASIARVGRSGGAPLVVTHLGPLRVIRLHCEGAGYEGYGAFMVDHCDPLELSWTGATCRLVRLDGRPVDGAAGDIRLAG